MSITTNGAPLGTDGVKALASTDSWQSPSEYVDPITGKTWRADTLEGLFELLEKNNVALFDHDAMRAANMTTAPKGNRSGQGPSGDDNAQWDRLLIQLQHYPDPEKAREIILGALANPDVSMTRNLGGGRTATKVLQGRRAVLSHEIHHDDERGPHFMAQVHTVALGPDGHISQKWSFSRGEDAKSMVVQVNAALAANGLAPLVFRLRDETGTSVAERKAQLDAQQSEEYRQAAEKGELPPLPDEDAADAQADAMPTSAKKENLRQAAQLAGAQAASLYAQAAALQKQNALYRQALRALEAEEQHLARIGALTTRLQEAVTNAAEAEAQHAATVAEQATVIEATQAKASELSEQLESTTATLAETTAMLESTEAELSQVKASLATVTSAKNELEKQLEDTSAQLRGVTDELAIATQNIDQLETRQAELSRALDTERLERKNETAAHEAEVSELRGELSSEKKAREKAETQLEKTRSDLADERTAHNAVKSELKAETKRADTAEKAAAKAQDELAALREQLATALAQSKAQAADLAREREARAQAEQAARTAMAAAATAEAQRDARPTQAQLQEAMAATAKAEAQRDALAERVEQLLKPQAPTPGNDNSGPKA